MTNESKLNGYKIIIIWSQTAFARGSCSPVLHYYSAPIQLLVQGHCRLSAGSEPPLALHSPRWLGTSYRFARGYFALFLHRRYRAVRLKSLASLRDSVSITVHFDLLEMLYPSLIFSTIQQGCCQKMPRINHFQRRQNRIVIDSLPIPKAENQLSILNNLSSCDSSST